MSQLDIDPIETILGRAERAGDAGAQASLLLEAAALYESGGQHDHAFLVRVTAYRLRPGGDERAALERLAALTGRAAELDALWGEAIPSLPVDERATAWRDLGRLRLRRLRAAEPALAALDVALALAPDEEAADLRAEALAELGRWHELGEALRAIADGDGDLERRCQALVRLADVRAQQLGDPLGAEEACRLALTLDPLQRAARARLESLVRARGDMRTLLTLLDDRAALWPDDIGALREAAELAHAVDGDAGAALRWTELRTRCPGDPAPLRALDGIYARLGRVRERIDVLEALAGVVDSERERAGAQRALAAAWSELGERGRAIEALEWLLLWEPEEGTWRQLSELYRQEGRFAALADACARHLRGPGLDAARRSALRRELARLYERDLGDYGQAIECWHAVAELEPDAADALEALARLYDAIDAPERAVECIERWAAVACDGGERAQRLLRAAELCASRPELDERTVELLERARGADPASVPVRLALVAELRARGELARAAAVLGDVQPGAHVALVAQAAALREAEGDLDGAFVQLRALVERVPGHVDARWRACTLALALGRHADALELAAPLPDDGPDGQRAERWILVAKAARAGGERALAAEALDRAAALAPTHRELGRLQVERLLAEGDVAAAEARLEALAVAAAEATAADRAALAFLAAGCARGRGDAAAALARCREAVALDPSHRQALRTLLDVAAERGAWDDALGALGALARLERDASLRARYRHLAGHICEEELGRVDEALGHYRDALDDDPDHPRSGERIAALLRRRGDFAALAAHCARQIERLGDGADPARRAQLWSELAAAAEGLGDTDGTTVALEVVVRLDATNWDARRRLATIYLEAGADAREQAIAAQHELLRLDKLHVPAYRALARLYADTGADARAAACEQAARLLSVRDPARARPLEASAAELPAMAAMTPGDWSRLRHADEEPCVSALSALLAPLLAGAAATPLDPARGFPGTPLDDAAASPLQQALAWVARTLDVVVPTLFARNDQMAPVRFVNGRDGRVLKPAFVVGLPLLGDRRRAGELLAPLALEAALLRPERLLRLLVPDAGTLTLLLRASVAVACDEAPAPELAVTAAALKRSLPPLALDQLGVVGRRLRADGRDLGRAAAAWLRAADLTAARAALVLSGDLPRTLAAVEACAFDPAGLRHALGEVVWASITDEVWMTRQRLVAGATAASEAAQARR